MGGGHLRFHVTADDAPKRGLDMSQICYLCALPLTDAKSTGDHIVPRLLISRKQPKAKGFDYAGELPTHAECNSRFGPERYCSKAIELIAVLNDANCVSIMQHKDDPSIATMMLNSECLKDFTKRDLSFFKFIDVRGKEVKEFSSPSFFSGKPKTDPTRDALFVALSVLTKSAAALLVKRHLHQVPSQWRVLAIPFPVTPGTTHFFDDLFAKTKPFDIGVKIWLQALSSDYWVAAYHARNILVYLLFRFSDNDYFWRRMIKEFAGFERLIFEGTKLMELGDYQWQHAQH